ncbi:MAG: hypothetical protein KAU20_02100, partial [Nanoarchaeota archaeon]|nr:hypothetical protein [Nanoarchaeota archaeon]
VTYEAGDVNTLHRLIQIGCTAAVYPATARVFKENKDTSIKLGIRKSRKTDNNDPDVVVEESSDEDGGGFD